MLNKFRQEITFDKEFQILLVSGEKVFLVMQVPRFSHLQRYKMFIEISDYKIIILEEFARNFNSRDRELVDSFYSMLKEEEDIVKIKYTEKKQLGYWYRFFYFPNDKLICSTGAVENLMRFDSEINNNNLNKKY